MKKMPIIKKKSYFCCRKRVIVGRMKDLNFLLIIDCQLIENCIKKE